MSLKVITVTNQPERAKPLLDSLTKHNWPHAMLITDWKGFGTKVISTYEYLKANPEVDRFIFCDAHDVVVLGTPEEFEQKLEDAGEMLFNGERGCWPSPVQHFEYLYFKTDGGFDYLNSGVYYCPSDLFIQMYEATPIRYETDDQWYFSMIYLFGSWPINIDKSQSVFNCHSFIRTEDYTYENGRVGVLGNCPLFIHGNGGGLPKEVIDLL